MNNLNSVFALPAGDFNQTSFNSVLDFLTYQVDPSEIYQYTNWDVDLDGMVTVRDFNFYKANAYRSTDVIELQ